MKNVSESTVNIYSALIATIEKNGIKKPNEKVQKKAKKLAKEVFKMLAEANKKAKITAKKTARKPLKEKPEVVNKNSKKPVLSRNQPAKKGTTASKLSVRNKAIPAKKSKAGSVKTQPVILAENANIPASKKL